MLDRLVGQSLCDQVRRWKETKDTNHAYICDAVRTPIGRYGGALASVRPDDLGAVPLTALMERNKGVDWEALDDVLYGCANQAGEDNRNIARMSLLLAGLPVSAGGTTINRLCGSGMDPVTMAAQRVMAGAAELVIAGGVESMSRAPLVIPKANNAYDRSGQMFDTTIGWRFVNPVIAAQYGIDSMPETAENVAEDFCVSRADQGSFRHGEPRPRRCSANQWPPGARDRSGEVTQMKGDAIFIDKDEHPRPTTLEALGKLRPIVRPEGTITAIMQAVSTTGRQRL
jgi:acetyl-CoA C-acetyltransferase